MPSSLPPKFDVEGLFPSIQGIKKDEQSSKRQKGAPADAKDRTHSMKIEKQSRHKVQRIDSFEKIGPPKECNLEQLQPTPKPTHESPTWKHGFKKLISFSV